MLFPVQYLLFALVAYILSALSCDVPLKTVLCFTTEIFGLLQSLKFLKFVPVCFCYGTFEVVGDKGLRDSAKVVQRIVGCGYEVLFFL